MSERLSDGEVIALWAENVPLARSDGTDDAPTLTNFLPADPTGSAMIVCPGGGYAGLADHEGDPVARWLNTVGITAFVLRYRLPARGYVHPAPLLDAQRAVRLVRTHADDWGLKRDRIGILGFSAGGHLSATLSTQFDFVSEAQDEIDRSSARPDVSVLLYPVITLRDPHTHVGSRSNLLGQGMSAATSAAMIDDLSAESRVTPQTPPAFMFHTVDDGAVNVENVLLYAAALRIAKTPFEMHLFQHGHHGVGLAAANPVLSAWPGLCAAWLKEHGF